MAQQPVTRLPEEDRANIRPDIPSLRTQEGIGTNIAGSSRGGSTNGTSGSQGGESSATAAKTGGEVDSTGAHKSVGGDALALSEAKASQGLGSPSLFNSNDTIGLAGKARLLTSRRIKNSTLFGAGSILTIIAILFMFFSISSGPFEFIHIAQLLGKDFASQEDAKDNRLSKIAQYIRDPSKPQNARVGLVGTAVATRLEDTLKEKTGLTPAFEEGGLGLGKGYTVDVEHGSYQGKNTNEVKKEILSKYGQYGITAGDIHIYPKANGKSLIQINNENLGSGHISRYRKQTALSRAILREAGYSKISAYAATRIEAQRSGWSFHPIKQTDQKITDAALRAAQKKGRQAIDKYKEQQKQKFIKEQVAYESGTVEAVRVSAEDKTAKDDKGNTTDPAGSQDAQALAGESGNVSTEAQQAAQDANDGKDGQQKFSESLGVKAAAGTAGLAGLLCIVNGLSQHIEQAKYDKAILPMMRKAGRAISIGSQAQSGQDISVEDLGNYSDFLNKKDENGKVVSTWNQSRAFQADLNQPQSGPDIPKEGQVFEGNPVDFLDNAPGLGAVCSALGSPLGQVAMLVTGPLNFIVGGEALKLATNFAAGWLSGSPVPANAAGADYGNYIKYGSKLLANDSYAAAGAAPIDASSVAILNDVSNDFDQQDFQSKNVAYRLFNPRDSRTLAAHIIDEHAGGGLQNVASMASGLTSIFSSALKIPGSLATSVTHAASKPYSYHGLKLIGFTPEELGDPQFDNPFNNACLVVGCHSDKTNITGIFEDATKAQTYTERAKKCFGVNITNDGTIWTIDAKTKAVNMYTQDYPESDCRSLDLEWKRVRFWLLDTSTIEGYDCAGDTKSRTSDQSCADIGFGGGGGGDATNTATQGNETQTDGSPAVTGSVAELAQKLLDSDKVTAQANPQSSLKAAAKGDKSPAGIDKCNVQHPPVALDPKLLGFLVDLSQVDAFTITSLTTGAHACTSNHYKGVAVDFGCDLDISKADSVGKKYGISHNFESCSDAIPHWHYSIGGD